MLWFFLKDLSYNKIDKQGFEILVDTINHFPSLLYLSLANCGIRDSYGRRIGDLCRYKRLVKMNSKEWDVFLLEMH
jgi:Ran GTPase-activating protein (RanGAP) involved in mRNA processing and transport